MLAVAFFLLFVTLDFDRSLLTLGVAHSVVATPFATLIVYGRLRFAQQLPVLIAMAVLFMVGTVTLTLIAQRLRREDPA